MTCLGHCMPQVRVLLGKVVGCMRYLHQKSPHEAGFDTSFAAWTAGRADSHYFIV
jgi:hypothetical protein